MVFTIKGLGVFSIRGKGLIRYNPHTMSVQPTSNCLQDLITSESRTHFSMSSSNVQRKKEGSVFQNCQRQYHNCFYTMKRYLN